MLLARIFERVISVGRLRVIDARGKSHAFNGSPGGNVTVRLHDPTLHWKLILRPRLYLLEALMDETLTIEEGKVYDLLDLLAVNIEALPRGLLASLLNGSATLRRVHQYNPARRARRNAAHHYDLSDQLYELF